MSRPKFRVGESVRITAWVPQELFRIGDLVRVLDIEGDEYLLSPNDEFEDSVWVNGRYLMADTTPDMFTGEVLPPGRTLCLFEQEGSHDQ